MTSVHLVVMGVSGCGKSTVAHALGEVLGWEVLEGDDLHPASSIEKMRSGTPLTDADRWPWLDTIAEWTAARTAAGTSTIVSCSALRRAYRDRLRAGTGRTVFVHLAGSAETLRARLDARTGHFMPPALLISQLTTLEPLEPDEEGMTVDVAEAVEDIVAEVVSHLAGATNP